MGNFKKLSHVISRCTYHIGWTPKYRYRVLESLVKELLSKDILMLLEWKSGEMIEMNIQKDHLHLMESVSSKISISQLMGAVKGKTAIKIFKKLSSVEDKTVLGQSFLSKRVLRWHNRTWRREHQVMREISRRSRTSRRAAAAQLWLLIGASS